MNQTINYALEAAKQSGGITYAFATYQRKHISGIKPVFCGNYYSAHPDGSVLRYVEDASISATILTVLN